MTSFSVATIKSEVAFVKYAAYISWVASPRASRPSVCDLYHRASELIGRRWTGAILFLLLRGRCRFADLRGGIPGITDRMLSERLQELEAEGIVERGVIPETPVRIEYSLTPKGEALSRPIESIGQWAHDWLGPGASATAAARRARRVRRPEGAGTRAPGPRRAR